MHAVFFRYRDVAMILSPEGSTVRVAWLDCARVVYALRSLENACVVFLDFVVAISLLQLKQTTWQPDEITDEHEMCFLDKYAFPISRRSDVAASITFQTSC